MALVSIIRDNVRLSCRAVGDVTDGRATLCIHGLNANLAFWHPLVVRRLAEEQPVVMFDLRGHGASDLPSSGYTLHDLADDARAVLDAHGVSQADVVAHSFGTGVALQLARQEPGRVRRLTILDGRLRSLQGDVRLRDWAHFARWRKQLGSAADTIDPDWEIDCRLPLRMADVDFSSVSSDLEREGFFVPRFNKRSGEKYRRLMQETKALEELDDECGLTRESLREISQPVLLVYGTVSPFLPTCDVLAAELPSAQVEILDGAGHNFPLTHPEQTLRALERWTPSRDSSTSLPALN